MSEKKYIVCCDFDGVLHSYDSGWKGACNIPDPPVPGAFHWLTGMWMRKREFVDEQGRNEIQVVVYSSRSKEPGAIDAMKAWFREHGLQKEVLDWLEFPTQKPAASMTIDDRAFCFEGDFPSPEWLLRFIPWNKRRKLTYKDG